MEKAKQWLLGVSKYFRVHNYSSEMKARLAIYNLNGKSSEMVERLEGYQER